MTHVEQNLLCGAIFLYMTNKIWHVEQNCSTWKLLLHRQCLWRLRQIWFMSQPWWRICNFCDTYCWWGIVLKRRIFPGMSGMIRVNLLKPVSSYFSCHFRTVMLLPKLSLFILLAWLFLLFLRQWWLFTCGQMLCQSQASRREWKMCHLTTVVRSNIFQIQIEGCSMYIPDRKLWGKQICKTFGKWVECQVKCVNSWETLPVSKQGSRGCVEKKGVWVAVWILACNCFSYLLVSFATNLPCQRQLVHKLSKVPPACQTWMECWFDRMAGNKYRQKLI